MLKRVKKLFNKKEEFQLPVGWELRTGPLVDIYQERIAVSLERIANAMEARRL